MEPKFDKACPDNSCSCVVASEAASYIDSYTINISRTAIVANSLAVYTVGNSYKKNESKLFCLKVTVPDTYKPFPNDAPGTPTYSIFQWKIPFSPTNESFFFPIEKEGGDWSFEVTHQSVSPGKDNPIAYSGSNGYIDCINSIRYKAYSYILDKLFTNVNQCKTEEIIANQNLAISRCKANFIPESAGDYTFKNTESCNFGKDIILIPSTYQYINGKYSCTHSANQSSAIVKLNWLPNLKFVCAGVGVNKYNPSAAKPADVVTYAVRSQWVVCPNATDITGNKLFKYTEGPTVGGAINLSYDIGDPGGCKPCSDKNGDGKVHIQDCDGYVKEPTSECSVTADKSCTFGNIDLNTNCAKSQNYQNRFISQTGDVYFCASNNKTVMCDGTKRNSTYEDIFLQTMNGNIRYYDTINPASKCNFVDKINEGTDCKLPKDQSLSCNFGPMKTDAALSSSNNPENCDELSDTVGMYEAYGKFVYCSPAGKKVTCDQKVSNYQTLFNVSVNTADMQKDYTNVSKVYATFENRPYYCREGIPEPSGCDVSTDRSIFSCGIPSSCYDLNRPVPLERPYDRDILKGFIYCIHDKLDNPKSGLKYWCPSERNLGIPRSYDSFTEKITDSSNIFVIFKNSTSWGKDNCILFSQIANECSKSGEYYNTAAGKKRCQCSRQFNPNYDPFVCGVTPDISWCEPRCKLLDVKEVGLEPVEIDSPLALVKVAAGFLFWAAVMLFIINFMSSGIEYIQHSDEPDKVKDATTRLTNTLFGFIFLLVSAGVINYLLTLFLEIVK